MDREDISLWLALGELREAEDNLKSKKNYLESVTQDYRKAEERLVASQLRVAKAKKALGLPVD